LDSGGYVYDIDHEVYFNRSAKKIFSVEFLEKHNPAEIEQSIRGWGYGGLAILFQRATS
jgi:hypothetical protein